MDVHSLIEAASRGERPLVSIIVGTERLFVDRAVTALRRATVGEGDPWNEEVFNGKSTTAARIVDAARTIPMLGGARFILVRAIDELADKELDNLVPYLNAPVDSACVVMTAEKLDGRARLTKAAKQHGYFIEAQPLKLPAMREFVWREVKRRKLTLHEDAAASLVDAIGTDLSALDDGLERLSLYVGEGQPITREAVEACVSRVRVDTIWALVDAVGHRGSRSTPVQGERARRGSETFRPPRIESSIPGLSGSRHDSKGRQAPTRDRTRKRDYGADERLIESEAGDLRGQPRDVTRTRSTVEHALRHRSVDLRDDLPERLFRALLVILRERNAQLLDVRARRAANAAQTLGALDGLADALARGVMAGHGLAPEIKTSGGHW
jgi:hypothetical protein